MWRRRRNDRWRLRTLACRVCYQNGWWRLRHEGGHVGIPANPAPYRAVTVNGEPVPVARFE